MTRFSVQLPDDVVDQVRVAAAEADISVDHLLASLVTQGLDYRRGHKVLSERSARGNATAALAILDRVADVEPDPEDRIL